MKKANIFLVEDCVDLARAIESYLSNFDFNVILCATNKEQALELIANGELEKNDITIAIIDGIFPNSNEDFCEDFNGPEVAKSVKERNPEIKTISFSLRDNCTYGDFNVEKSRPSNLMGTIRSIVN